MGFWDGTFTDYGTAIGTVSLALITTVFGMREAKDRKLLKAERDHERNRADHLEQEKAAASAAAEVRRAADQAAQERRRLATGVSCYIGPMARDATQVITASGGPPKSGSDPIDCATIRNTGDKPIRDVTEHWQDASSPDPTGGEAQIAFGGGLSVLPAMGQRNIAKPETLAQWHSSQLALLARFTDFHGNHWACRSDGRLHAVIDGVLGPQEP